MGSSWSAPTCPGLSKDDIKVEITEDMLSIQGERKQEKKEEREGYFYNECSYGSFYRAVPLPEGVDASKATAEFRNGVLEIAMPAPATIRDEDPAPGDPRREVGDPPTRRGRHARRTVHATRPRSARGSPFGTRSGPFRPGATGYFLDESSPRVFGAGRRR